MTSENPVNEAPEKNPPPAAPAVPAHVAANICKLLERVQVTGVESLAWAEAFQLMHQLAGNASQPHGPGIPFQGLRK